MLVGDSNPLDALHHLERLRKTHPDRLEVSIGLARCRILEGKLGEAGNLLDEVLSYDPQNPAALLFRGELELEQGRSAQAEVYLRHALKNDPYIPGAIYSLAQCLQDLGGHDAEVAELLARFENQKRDFQRISELMKGQLERDPHNADGPSELGTLFLRVGHVQLGVHWLYTALERDPNHKPTHEALIAYFDKTNQPEKAKEHRVWLEKINPKPSSSSP